MNLLGKPGNWTIFSKCSSVLYKRTSSFTRCQSILVLNPGSTSLKYSLFRVSDMKSSNPTRPHLSQQITICKDLENELDDFLTTHKEKFANTVAIGLRAVHGGTYFKETREATVDVIETLKSIIPLAPLHLPMLVKMLSIIKPAYPTIPCYVSFDTSFFSQLPDYTRFYPLPYDLGAEGIVRYGFHGLNHRYCSEQIVELVGTRVPRLITCHLGGGASVSAIKDGVCVDTSMGYTPLDGIMMLTRCGSLDPSIVLKLVRDANGDVDAVERMLNHDSGVCGIYGDKSVGFKAIVDICKSDPRAKLAYEMFINRLNKAIGSFLPALGGVDAIVFSGGIGENDALVRADVIRHLDFLGARLDNNANQRYVKDKRIVSTSDSTVTVAVIPANEEWVIARDVRRMINGV